MAVDVGRLYIMILHLPIADVLVVVVHARTLDAWQFALVHQVLESTSAATGLLDVVRVIE